MRSFFLPNWSPPDDPARPLPAEGRPWPSGDDYDDSDDVKMMMHHNVTSICVQCEYKLELHILTITSISSSFAGLAYKDRTEHR